MSFFHFRYFSIQQSNAGLKVGTDAMVLGAFIDSEGKKNGLDIGTGTGVLSLMIAQRNPSIQIDAVENQIGALEDAHANFQKSPFSERLKEVNIDFLDFEAEHNYDLVFSNPPYYENAKLSNSQKLNDAKHVGELTPQFLFEKVAKILTRNGSFWLIWPFQSSEELIEKANNIGLNLQKRIVVNGKAKVPSRVILQFGFASSEIIESDFTIREANGEYTHEYKELTRDFHYKEL